MFNVEVYARSNGSWSIARPENPRYNNGNFSGHKEAQAYADHFERARVIRAK